MEEKHYHIARDVGCIILVGDYDNTSSNSQWQNVGKLYSIFTSFGV